MGIKNNSKDLPRERMEKNKALRWVGNFLLGKKKKSDLTNSKVASHSLKSYKSNPYHPPKKKTSTKRAGPLVRHGIIHGYDGIPMVHDISPS